ncbi:MAG TPA: lysylphosphatidylglycerol synthase transmembrane domain-containing protein [Anaerolineales bacterium]|nr:lysylphosphatidylglycerol synthase transmembrane domain-containing protein [Anaerolineales bacterium]
MSAPERSNWGSLGRWLPGLILSTLSILMLVWLTNWEAVERALAIMGVGWVLPAVLLFLISNALRALAWRTLLQNKAPYGRVFLTLNEGYLINNILPFRLGELARAFLLAQSANLSALFVLATIVIERAFDIAIAAGLLLVTLPFVLGVEAAKPAAWFALCLVGLGLAALYLAARYRERIETFLERRVDRFPFLRKILPRLNSIFEGLGILERPSQFLLALGLLLSSWFFGLAEVYVVFNSANIAVPAWWSGFVLGALSFGIALPSAPAGIGIYEVAMVGALSLLGVAIEQALAFAIVVHLIHILVTGLIGSYGLIRDGETLTGIYRRVRTWRKAEVLDPGKP